jgi:lipopolysaccharide transport system ATP-binding protein
MSDAIISVTNLGKCYRLAHQRKSRRYVALRDVLAEKARRLISRNHKSNGDSSGTEEFWALKNVSFEINRGDVVGFIGRNGAGKSTLLKILSRITEPTTGRVTLRGRVASLLEVGTGFHPELTGRENIFLNGAILGMHRSEIKSKFDEIVAFAEVEKFLDTPVKHYSSGMYVRLAFAVAAHLEPEILIVDEVLAVGDAQFQKKCMGKMQDVSSKYGRTVLFVSHNMAAIRRLCTRCIILKSGQVIAAGSTDSVINEYVRDDSSNGERSLEHFTPRSGSGVIRLLDIYFEDVEGNKIQQVQSGSDFFVVLRFKCAQSAGSRNVNVGISLHQPDETMISVLYSSYTGQTFESVSATGTFRCHIKRIPLKQGRYMVGARVEADGEEADWPQGMIGALDILESDFYGSGAKGFDGSAPLLLSGSWSVR